MLHPAITATAIALSLAVGLGALAWPHDSGVASLSEQEGAASPTVPGHVGPAPAQDAAAPGSTSQASTPQAAGAEQAPPRMVEVSHAWEGTTWYNANAHPVGSGHATTGPGEVPIPAPTELAVMVQGRGGGVAVGGWRVEVRVAGGEVVWEATGPEARGPVPAGDLEVLVLAADRSAQVAWDYTATATWMQPAPAPGGADGSEPGEGPGAGPRDAHAGGAVGASG